MADEELKREEKKFKYDYQKEYELIKKNRYQETVRHLALYKNDLLFNGILDASLKTMVRNGIDVSRKKLLLDIDTEIEKQQLNHKMELSNMVKTI